MTPGSEIPNSQQSAANENELKLVVVTVALRVPANTRVDSIYGIDTKNDYFGDIEAYEVMEVPYA